MRGAFFQICKRFQVIEKKPENVGAAECRRLIEEIAGA
jgi:hypothetical protein